MDGAVIATELRAALGDVRTLVVRARVARAASLARGGRVSEAAELLSDLSLVEPPDARVLELAARLDAQRGKLADAGAKWRLVLELAPEHEPARRALARIESIVHRSGRMAFLSWPSGRSVLLVLAAILALTEFVGLRRDLGELRAVLARGEAGAAAQSIDVAGAPASAAQPGVAERAPQVLIAVAGVRSERQGAETILSFETPLFSEGTRLRPEAERMLATLAQTLAPLADSVEIQVEGFTDATPMSARSRYRDNAALGLARAAAVIERLRAAARLPAERLSARAAESPDAARTAVVRMYPIPPAGSDGSR